MEELTVIAVKQRYNASVWRKRISACRSSGQTVANWCTENSINRSSYYHWERKLLREAGNEIGCTQQSQRFAEIPPMTNAANVVAVLRVGEITCVLHRGISAEQLSAMLQGMKSHA